MKHVALVTCSTFPRLSQSDEHLVDPLKTEGFIPYVVPWDKKGVDWSLFDTIILRSCWNYPEKYSLFLDWLAGINTKIYNPAAIIKWNSHKSYLLDLGKKGIPIIPTVIKPAIGNRGRGVEYLVQPFIPEIAQEGEYRFIFIGGKLTHTVLKTQKKVTLVQPSQALAQQAAHALDTDFLYARVDGINRSGIFLLLELELIEPHLYFDMNPFAATRFAQTLKSYG